MYDAIEIVFITSILLIQCTCFGLSIILFRCYHLPLFQIVATVSAYRCLGSLLLLLNAAVVRDRNAIAFPLSASLLIDVVAVFN